jgi:thiol-disulfide isomerase/thioredoxin
MIRRSAKIKSPHTILLVSLLSFAVFVYPVFAFSTKSAKLPSFGKGKIHVRLYTDYFCGPCSRMEPKVEKLLSDLVKRNVITLTLIDTPVHSGTPLYAKYFLYILEVKRDIEHALESRAVLFEAANNKIEGSEKLEEYLKNKDVKFRQADHSDTFTALSALINEDIIKSTPTCVIISDGKKAAYTGETDITTALQALR